MESSRCRSHKSLRSIDKEAKDGKDNEKVPYRPRIKRRQKTTDAVEVSFEERTQSVGLSKAPNVAPEAREGSSHKISSSLREILELLREGLVRKPGFRSLQAITNLVGVLSSPVNNSIMSIFAYKDLSCLVFGVLSRSVIVILCYGFSFLFVTPNDRLGFKGLFFI